MESDLQLSFRTGEIVILTGIVGSGVKDIAEAMFGARFGWDVSININGYVSINLTHTIALKASCLSKHASS